EKTLVGAHLELLAALLVHMRRTVDRELLDAGRKRDRAADIGAGALCRRNDFPCRSIEHAMVKRFQAYADILSVHSSIPCSGAARAFTRPRQIDCLFLFDDCGDDAGADGAAAF